MKKYCLLLFCMFLWVPFQIQAQGYDMVEYHYDASISQNHTMDIQEQYQIYVYQSNCLWERNLSDIQKGVQRNGNTFSRKNLILNVNVDSSDFVVHSKNHEKTIVIHPNIDIENYGIIHLSYQRDLGKIIRNQKDELFFDIVDGTFQNMLSDIHFKVNLPITVSDHDIRFYLNGNETHMVSYQIENNTIIGTLNTALGEDQTLSLSILFPKGYFVRKQIEIPLSFTALLLPILCFCYAISVWIRYIRKNRKDSEMIVSKFDPAELSFLMNGYTQRKDLISIFLVLANQGYLQIVCKDGIYALEKIKSYDGKNALQKTVFDELFHEFNRVTETELKAYLDTHESELKEIIDNPDHQNIIFEKKYQLVFFFSHFFILLGSFGAIGLPIYFHMHLPVLAIFLSMFLFLGTIFTFIPKHRMIMKYIGIIFLFMVMAIGGYYLYTEILLWIMHLMGTIFLCISASIFHNLSKRTHYGTSVLKDISQFRTTLYQMSIPRLQEKLEEEPNYFYEMISYAYVFGFYDKWMMNGYQIISKLPSFYIDNSCGSLKTLRKSLSKFLLRLEIEDSQK